MSAFDHIRRDTPCYCQSAGVGLGDLLENGEDGGASTVPSIDPGVLPSSPSVSSSPASVGELEAKRAAAGYGTLFPLFGSELEGLRACAAGARHVGGQLGGVGGRLVRGGRTELR
jgi:hypothetical protein